MKLGQTPININISTFTIFKILIVAVLVYFLFLIKNILAILFVSLVLASAVDPLVDWLEIRRVSRGISIVLIYVVSLFVMFLVVTSIIPPIINEFNDLVVSSPEYIDKAISGYSSLKEYSIKYGFLDNIKENLGSLSTGVQGAASGVFSTVGSIFGGLFSFFLVLVITFYMVVEENAMKKLIWSVSPKQYQDYMMGLMNRMQRKIGLWLRGQVILSLTIFVLTYLGLLVLEVEYALVLALIAGLTEFVPYMGPMLGAIPAIFLAFTQDPTLAITVAILYYIIQVIENNILVPKIMQKAVGLNPIISISVLMIGFQLAGIMGAILSLPVATAAQEMILDIFEYKEKGGVVNNKIVKTTAKKRVTRKSVSSAKKTTAKKSKTKSPKRKTTT